VSLLISDVPGDDPAAIASGPTVPDPTTFADAQALVPYFARLGVSHLYASPIAVARPGSMHGYDVIDPTQINPELGGEEGLRAVAASLAQAGLGLILDIVPNHMAADTANLWWADVLRHGRASPYARFFDIDWEADDKVLLPILGRPLEEVLRRGDRFASTSCYFSTACRLRPGRARLFASPAFSSGVVAHRLRSLNCRLSISTSWSACAWKSRRKLRTLGRCAFMPRADQRPAHRSCRWPHRSAAYCRKLCQQLGRKAWLVVEKILLRRELAARLACDGTTGYDFMNDGARRSTTRWRGPPAGSGRRSG
jgi:hypothetical protein